MKVSALLALLATGLLYTPAVQAVTTTFFDDSQLATLVNSGTTSDTVSCDGYLFTYTRDKLFTGGVGMTEPIGRYVRVPWPLGVEAQAVTSGPNPGKAQITIRRVDGEVFALQAFTAQLLANTAGSGAAFEIVPFLDGEEVLPDPIYFDATGYSWSSFSYDTSPNWRGNTAALTGYDAYKINLFVDFALTELTLVDSSIPEPSTTALLVMSVGMLGVVRPRRLLKFARIRNRL